MDRFRLGGEALGGASDGHGRDPSWGEEMSTIDIVGSNNASGALQDGTGPKQCAFRGYTRTGELT